MRFFASTIFAFAAAFLGTTPNTCAQGQNIVELASSDYEFSQLVEAVVAADLVGVLSGTGPFTVFAPLNSAFNMIPGEMISKLLMEEFKPQLVDLLTYHVLNGKVFSTDLSNGMMATALNEETLIINIDESGVFINDDTTVVTADVDTSNGVVHIVNKVLLPTSTVSSIVDIAVSNPDFSILVDLAGLAGLVTTLQSGPLTLFAPTNAAFQALPARTLDMLRDPDNMDTLCQILTYHIVTGNLVSSRLHEGSLQTVQGKNIHVSINDNNNIMVNDANVGSANILATNGVIHVIDTVLIPPMSMESESKSRSYKEQNRAGNMAGTTSKMSKKGKGGRRGARRVLRGIY